VQRFVSIAFTGPVIATTEILASESVGALDDDEFALKIRDSEPQSLEGTANWQYD
jgi:hypothetical protein